MADLHIHTLASDGVSGVEEILAAAVEASDLDVIAITDHERIDAAVVAPAARAGRAACRSRSSWARRSPPATATWSGLFLTRAHQALGLHEATPSPGSTTRAASRSWPTRSCPTRCAPVEGTIRRLLDEADQRHHPDAIEAFNPTTARMRWSRRVPAFVAEVGLARGGRVGCPPGGRSSGAP